MSDTKKDAWLSNSIKLIFMERDPSKQKSNQTKTNRFSTNFAKELENLHEKRKMAKKPILKGFDESHPFNDSMIANDESFEALERMCDKTMSDPDSTLFQYLHSDHKEGVLANAKKRSDSSDTGFSMESMNFDKVKLSDSPFRYQKYLEDESPLRGVDCTQLEDIEAPSRLWDNTITGSEGGLQASPVKMVGLLRPSTIIEGCEDDSVIVTDSSSQLSFQSAIKECVPSDTISSCYETANDQTETTRRGAAQVVDVDNLFYVALADVKPNLTKCESAEILTDFHKSFDLIDLSEFKEKPLTGSFGLLDESIIEIMSDDDDLDASIQHLAEVKHEKPHANTDLLHFTTQIDGSTSSAINENKENDVNADKSCIFNDTLEEVDYMMRKGLEYMVAATSEGLSKVAAQPPSLAAVMAGNGASKAMSSKQNTFLKFTVDQLLLPSPKGNILTATNSQNSIGETVGAIPKQNDGTKKIGTASPIRSFSAAAAKHKTGASRLELEMKTPSKKEFFKPPSSIPILRHKELKEPYSHIISPIRTYVQNTVTAPLMASARSKHTKADVLNSTAFRELELESRLYSHKKNTNINSPGIPNSKYKVLPKKAYISSDIKQIVDERTPVTIPGVQKIHKYLETAMLPAVLQHNGKVKVPGDKEFRQRNNSLADLSVISGDVSMYTLKDAKKF